MKLVCNVYRCSAKEGMYLYTQKDVNQPVLDTLPEALKKRLGKTTLAMTLILTPEKKLAVADAQKVIESIEAQGFYLQMPPSVSSDMQAVNRHNNHL